MISQQDPRWALKKINGTTSTLKSYGCLISCICYILQKAGYDVWPDQLARVSELFDGDMWKGWDKLPKIYPKLSYAWGELCKTSPAPLEKMIRELDDGYYPIIMLDYSPTTSKLDTHYLVCLAHDDKGNIKVGDPIDGAEVWLDSRYGTLDESKKILKVDVYHFEKNTNDVDMWDRIKKFLEEKKADEGKVREAFGALTDQPGLQRKVSDLQVILDNKQTILSQKDGIISDLKNELDGKMTTISTYTDFLEKCAEQLGCSADMAEITGQIAVAIGNEDKYQGCLIEKQDLISKQPELIKKEVDARTLEIQLSLKQANANLVQITQENDELKKENAKLKENKKCISLVDKIRKLLKIK